MNYSKYEEIARSIRRNIIRSIHAAGSGHPGGSLSAVEILTALYFKEMNIAPENPDAAGRDRFVLSKGHGAPVLYATLAERGFFDSEELLTLRKLGARLQGHLDMSRIPGVELSTGSLGQGFSTSIGMALAAKMDAQNARVYTLLGDGELQEGIVWEAAMSAAHYALSNLCAFVDWNGLQIDGANDDVMRVAPIAEKFRAFGWNVISIDGHSFAEIFSALDQARACGDRPSVIVAKTVKGKGVSFMENNYAWHGKAPNDVEFEQCMLELGGEAE